MVNKMEREFHDTLWVFNLKGEPEESIRKGRVKYTYELLRAQRC